MKTEHQFPNIGPDPLKADGEERKRLHDQTDERLSKACAVQQSGVPDQTALVWRIDLDRAHCDLIIAENKWEYWQGEAENLKKQLDAQEDLSLQVQVLREALQSVIPVAKDYCLTHDLDNDRMIVAKAELALSTPPSTQQWVRREVADALMMKIKDYIQDPAGMFELRDAITAYEQAKEHNYVSTFNYHK